MTFLIISGGHDYADPVYMNDDDDIDNDDVMTMTFLMISGGHDYADPVYMNDDDDIDNDDDGAYGITHKEIEITTRFKILTYKNLALKFVASIYFFYCTH